MSVLGLGACGLGTVAGFERDRAFYPVMMIVIASYYALFAVLGGDERALGVEIAISIVFVCLAVIGFRTNLWIVAAALLGHAGLDLVHGHVVTNAGVPAGGRCSVRALMPSPLSISRGGLSSDGVDEHNRLTFRQPHPRIRRDRTQSRASS